MPSPQIEGIRMAIFRFEIELKTSLSYLLVFFFFGMKYKFKSFSLAKKVLFSGGRGVGMERVNLLEALIA